MNGKIFGITYGLLLIVAVSLWVGLKYGSRIPVLKSLA